MPTRHRLLASVAGALTLLAIVVAPAWASVRSDVASLVNEARTADGHDPLTFNSDVDAVAQAWAEHLAQVGRLSHNPAYAAQIPAGWTGAAENVASNSDPTAAAMHTQLMESPGHRANIMGDFTHIGVGYAVDDSGGGWLVEVFARYPEPMPGDYGPAAPTPSEQPSSEPSTEPATTSPPSSTSTPEEPATQEPLPAGWLGLGSSGAEVMALQEDLATLGYEVIPDGDFGEITLDQVAEFQAAAGLAADGLVGPQTRTAIDDAVAESSQEPTTAETTPSRETSTEPRTPGPSWSGTATPDIVPTAAEPPASAGGSLERLLPTPALVGILGGASAAFAALALLRRRIRAAR